MITVEAMGGPGVGSGAGSAVGQRDGTAAVQSTGVRSAVTRRWEVALPVRARVARATLTAVAGRFRPGRARMSVRVRPGAAGEGGVVPQAQGGIEMGGPAPPVSNGRTYPIEREMCLAKVEPVQRYSERTSFPNGLNEPSADLGRHHTPFRAAGPVPGSPRWWGG